MTGMLRVPRSRGALNGGLLVLLGIWGGLIAFVGPYFHYAYTPDKAFTYTTGRLWLEILPAAGAIVGGLILGGTASRPVAIFGAWLAALSGAWFVLGGQLSALWHTGGSAGVPVGDNLHRVVEQIGFFTGLGLVIVFLAAVALGRFTVIGIRERTLAEAPAAETVPAGTLPARTVPAGEMPAGEIPAGEIPAGEMPAGEMPAGETTRPVGAPARVPDTEGTDTVPSGSMASSTPPNTGVEETRVAGTSGTRGTTSV
jgi:hypothetical protein